MSGRKKLIIILMCILFAAIVAVAVTLVWLFPLRDKWTGELAAFLSLPEQEERYVCDMARNSRSRSGAETSKTFRVIRNAESDGVWEYIGNDDSGCYMAGDVCYKYDGDPLADGQLTYCGRDISVEPAYITYFGFLFGEGEFYGLDEVLTGVNKFVWGGQSIYTFYIAPEWFMQNEDINSYVLYDNPNYHYSDLRFKAVCDNATGAVVRLGLSYSYFVRSHMDVTPPAYPGGSFGTDFVSSSSGEVEYDAVFTYPEQDTAIQTEQQYEFSNNLNEGKTLKEITLCDGEYLSTVVVDEYVSRVSVPMYDLHLAENLKVFPSQDIMVRWVKNIVDVYRTSTLEKLCTMRFNLGIVNVDADGGKLLVTTLMDLDMDMDFGFAWLHNLCFTVFNLSDFSIVAQHKVEGDSYVRAPAYLCGDSIIYVAQKAELAFYNYVSGKTTLMGIYCGIAPVMDRQNGLVWYDCQSTDERWMYDCYYYDLSTGQTVVKTENLERDYNPVLIVDGYTISFDTANWLFRVSTSAGQEIYSFYGSSTELYREGQEAVRMADGKYLLIWDTYIFVADFDKMAEDYMSGGVQ